MTEIKIIQKYPGGHRFKADPNDPTKIEERYLGDYHSGYECVECKAIVCIYCHPQFSVEYCWAADPVIPGLEYSE